MIDVVGRRAAEDETGKATHTVNVAKGIFCVLKSISSRAFSE